MTSQSCRLYKLIQSHRDTTFGGARLYSIVCIKNKPTLLSSLAQVDLAPARQMHIIARKCISHVTCGDVHLAGFCGYPLAVAIPMLRVSAWKNAMGAMENGVGAINRCVAFIDGAHGRKGHDSPERNPFRARR